MKVWERGKGQFIEESEYGAETLNFLYNTCVGRILLRIIFASRWFSKMVGVYQRSPLSRKQIRKFIKNYNIDMSLYQDVETYRTFEEFFRRDRDIKQGLNQEVYAKDNLISIADAKLTVINLTSDSTFVVKRSVYDLEELILDEKLSKEFENGICLIYRLTADDYHHYVFSDSGNIENQYFIKGKLHTVQSVSDKYKVYTRNTRCVNVLDTDNFGKVLQIEVGAMLIGKINNKPVKQFKRLEEKGFFDYGGSTIIQIIKSDNVSIADDIIEKSRNDVETKVRVGEIIGKSKL